MEKFVQFAEAIFNLTTSSYNDELELYPFEESDFAGLFKFFIEQNISEDVIKQVNVAWVVIYKKVQDEWSKPTEIRNDDLYFEYIEAINVVIQCYCYEHGLGFQSKYLCSQALDYEWNFNSDGSFDDFIAFIKNANYMTKNGFYFMVKRFGFQNYNFVLDDVFGFGAPPTFYTINDNAMFIAEGTLVINYLINEWNTYNNNNNNNIDIDIEVNN